MPHRQGSRAGRRPPGRRRRGPAGRRRRSRGLAGMAPLVLGGARSRLPPRRRAARRAVARHAERRHDARPVEDGAPGRDRRRVRADRLLPLQRPVHDADLRRAADLVAGRLEPDGVPPARGLRLRGHAVQLHRDRRQPDELAGADGQHRRLEAGLDGDALGVLPDAPVRGRRAAARRDQPGLRRRRGDRRPRAREPRPRRHPLHRLDRGLPRDVEDRSATTSTATATTRASSARPAARTSSSRTRPPNVDALATAIVRGSFEYQGQKCSAASRVYAPSNLWPELRERLQQRGGDDHDGRRRRLQELHGRGDRRRLVRDAEGGDRGGEGRRRHARSSSAAATTTRGASSSSRR